jgi:GNAT superfamily N-acetyltransferase
MTRDTAVSAAAFKPRPATSSDVPGICALYFAAFAGSLILDKCFPASSPQVQAFVAAQMRRDVEDPSCITYVIPDEDGGVIASACWERPHDPAGTGAAAATTTTEWPADGDPALAQAFFSGMERKKEEIMRGRRFWHLHLIMVLPGYRRRGLASQLMNWGVERADEDGLALYLDAAPMAKALYEKFGFKTVDSLTFDDGKLTQYMMVRDPNL